MENSLPLMAQVWPAGGPYGWASPAAMGSFLHLHPDLYSLKSRCSYTLYCNHVLYVLWKVLPELRLNGEISFFPTHFLLQNSEWIDNQNRYWERTQCKSVRVGQDGALGWCGVWVNCMCQDFQVAPWCQQHQLADSGSWCGLDLFFGIITTTITIFLHFSSAWWWYCVHAWVLLWRSCCAVMLL